MTWHDALMVLVGVIATRSYLWARAQRNWVKCREPGCRFRFSITGNDRATFEAIRQIKLNHYAKHHQVT